MSPLLDTHIWLGSHVEPERPPGQVAATLTGDASRRWLSPISVRECLPLAERGHVQRASGQATHDGVETALSRVPVRDAPVSPEGVLGSRSVRLPHEDRADRFLAATAHDVPELALVTADERRLRGEGSRRLADR